MILTLLAALLFWLVIAWLAVLLGVAVLILGVTAADWWRDRDACKRAERLVDPRVRTLVDDLDRIWALDCARDRDLRSERTSLVADLYALERCPARKVRL